MLEKLAKNEINSLSLEFVLSTSGFDDTRGRRGGAARWKSQLLPREGTNLSREMEFVCVMDHDISLCVRR